MIFFIYFVLFWATVLAIRTQISSPLLIRLMDQPNERSSHSSPTPSAGGLSLLLMYIIGIFLLRLLYPDLVQDRTHLLLCAATIGFIGLIDDYFNIPPLIRLVAQFLLAFIVFFNVLLPELDLHQGTIVRKLVLSAYVLLALTTFVWLVNLYNFMDGIDGYAATQTIFVTVSAATLMLFFNDSVLDKKAFTFVLWIILLAVIMCAFIPFNWPNAKLFMGDTGSGFIGFIIGCFILNTLIQQSMSIQTWLILLSVFVADSSLALFRRIIRKDVVYKAHRSHAYQNMSRKYKSHSVVTITAVLVNTLIIAPAAFISHVYTDLENIALVVVYLSLLVSFYFAGSGVSGLYELNE